MEKLVKLTLSPFSPNLEVVNGMVMKVHAPYSEQSVTIQFNPNIQDYKEQEDQLGLQARQVMFSTSTEQTQSFLFDFETNNVHDVMIENIEYNVKLMGIWKEQGFFYFEFLLTTA